MRNHITSVVCLLMLLFTASGCYDRDIIDGKEFNHSLPKVENLTCTMRQDTAVLAWNIPTPIPADIRRPIEVKVQVVENDIYRQTLTAPEAKSTLQFKTDATKKYRFIVKLFGHIKPQNRVTGESDRIYSEGVIVATP